jgi:hypothetical protein
MRLEFGCGRLAIAIVSFMSLGSAAQAQTAAGQTALQPAIAQTAVPPPVTYGADIGIGETDNVTLVPTNKVSQTIATADVDFTVKEQSRLFDVDAKGNFSDLDYLQNAYGNQLIGRFDGQGQVALIPDRLTWVVRDDFGQTTLDAFTPVTPNNIQDVNYVSTGPNLSLPVGGTGFINATARYAEAYYQTSPYGSNRFLATLAGGLQLSAGSSVSLNGATERVDFQNTMVNTDFDRSSVFGRYEVQGARSDFWGDLGATRIDQGGNSSTGALAKLQISRQLSAAAKLTFTAGRELTDASSSFSTLSTGPIGIITFAPTPLTSDSYTSDYASVGWQYARNRTTVALTGRWERDRYAGEQQFDLTLGDVEFTIERQLTRAFSVQLLGRLYKYDYPNAVVASIVGSTDYDTGLVGAAFVWRHGRGLEVRMRYEHNSYVVSTGNTGYQENRVFLTVGYRPRLTPVPD